MLLHLLLLVVLLFLLRVIKFQACHGFRNCGLLSSKCRVRHEDVGIVDQLFAVAFGDRFRVLGDRENSAPDLFSSHSENMRSSLVIG